MKNSNIYLPVSTETWIVGDANPRMLSATITEFQQLPKGYIRPLNVYAFESSAPILQTVIGTCNPFQLIRNSTYFVKQQNFVVYDSTGNLLESKNSKTGQSNAIVMDYFNQFPTAKVSNATLNNIAYTSFESDNKGGWSISNYVKNLSTAITGKCSYNLSSGAISKSGLTSSTNYIVTYWTTNASPVTVSGSSGSTLLLQQNGWRLHSHPVTAVTSTSISGTGIIDELRLYPKDANMETTSYEPFVGPTSVCDARNIIAYNYYDGLNRVVLQRDKDLNIVKKMEFSDGILINSLPNWKWNGEFKCQEPLNGKRDSVLVDENPYSSLFNTKKYVFENYNCFYCTPTCNLSDPSKKIVFCNCETGAKYYTASVYKKVWIGGDYVWGWECTYHYLWTDGSISPDYTEANTSSCAITPVDL